MWRCLVEENVGAGQVSNVGCGDEHGPIGAHKLEEREYKNMVKEWWLWFDVVCCVTIDASKMQHGEGQRV